MADFNQHFLTAINASIEAGLAILKVYESTIEVELKDDKSPLTQADKASHLVIKKALEGTCPILSEEGREINFEERKSWKQFWLVDPLDGTKEFIKRNGQFTVNIAFIENGFPAAGIIYVPVTKELFFALEGKAYKAENIASSFQSLSDATKNAVTLNGAYSGKVKVVASRSHMSAETEEVINSLKTKHGEVEVVSAGSSLKFCLVAENKAAFYPRYAPTMEWDTGAGQAIVEAAGGKVIDYTTQQRKSYNNENLLNNWFLVTAKGFEV